MAFPNPMTPPNLSQSLPAALPHDEPGKIVIMCFDGTGYEPGKVSAETLPSIVV